MRSDVITEICAGASSAFSGRLLRFAVTTVSFSCAARAVSAMLSGVPGLAPVIVLGANPRRRITMVYEPSARFTRR